MNGRATRSGFLSVGVMPLLLHVAFSATDVRGQPPAMLAVYADGSEARGVLTDVESLAATRIGGQPLFAADRSVRWLRTLAAHDGELTAERASARRIDGSYLELDNGDLLPGAVLRHRPESLAWIGIGGTDDAARHPVTAPALLLVEPTKSRVEGPVDQVAAREIRVRRDRVRRIVWREDTPRRHQPRTLVPLDGSAVAYRSLRWLETGVLVLLEGGETERYEFTELAELNLPGRDDPWDAWFDELAGSALAADDRLVRTQTNQGLLLTAAVSRVRHVADGKLWSNSGFFILRPSWSLDAFTVADGDVVAMSCFLPTEVPLAVFPPTAVRQRPTFGGSWQWQAERSVQGGPLCLGGKLCGWGFGVQAHAEAEFPLSAAVTGFRGRVGLDRAAGEGGCARAAVFVNEPTGRPLWQSDLFIGSAAVADTGVLALTGPGGGQRSIVLVADAAHEGRPPAADPYDIRDAVDWAEPMLLLDPAALAARVAARLPEQIPAWKGWRLELDPPIVVRAMPVADPVATDAAGFTLTTVAEGGPLRLTRQWTVGPDDRNLLIAVSGTGGTDAALEVKTDGMRWRLPLPPRAATAPATPHVLPLDPSRGGPLAVEIVVPAGAAACWHALAVTGPLEGPTTVRLERSAPAAGADAAPHLIGTPLGDAP